MRMIVLQALAWALAAALLMLSWVPPAWRFVTGAPRPLEHLVAFSVAGFLFAAAYPGRRLQVLGWGFALIAVIELLQIVAPGRHAYATDFLLNALGFGMGTAGAVVHERIRS
jgi:glycopeptide antibiotics resistance protein